jgi:outer membrane lipoprotein-sorting protein
MSSAKNKQIHIVILLTFLLLIIFNATNLNAASTAIEKPWASLSKTVNRYRDFAAVKMVLEKKLVLKALGKEKTNSGTLLFSKGRLLLEISKPEKSILIYDNVNLWNIQYPPEEFGGDPTVSRASINPSNRDQIFFSNIMTKGALYKQYTIKTANIENNEIKYLMKAKDKSTQIQDLEFFTDLKSNEITRMIYSDELDNKSTLSFSKVEFLNKIDDKLFVYKPGKNIKVDNL